MVLQGRRRLNCAMIVGFTRILNLTAAVPNLHSNGQIRPVLGDDAIAEADCDFYILPRGDDGRYICINLQRFRTGFGGCLPRERGLARPVKLGSELLK
eukprot:6969114-Pyramimonas_sp.AAC.1